MISTKVILDGDNSLPEIAGKIQESEGLYAITALPGGMASGKPSIAFISQMADGTFVFSQTSMAIFFSRRKSV